MSEKQQFGIEILKQIFNLKFENSGKNFNVF
jgi:hypothetical protein